MSSEKSTKARLEQALNKSESIIDLAVNKFKSIYAEPSVQELFPSFDSISNLQLNSLIKNAPEEFKDKGQGKNKNKSKNEGNEDKNEGNAGETKLKWKGNEMRLLDYIVRCLPPLKYCTAEDYLGSYRFNYKYVAKGKNTRKRTESQLSQEIENLLCNRLGYDDVKGNIASRCIKKAAVLNGKKMNEFIEYFESLEYRLLSRKEFSGITEDRILNRIVDCFNLCPKKIREFEERPHGISYKDYVKQIFRLMYRVFISRIIDLNLIFELDYEIPIVPLVNDLALVLAGEKGAGKTTAAIAMAGNPAYFTELKQGDINTKAKDRPDRMRLVREIPEVDKMLAKSNSTFKALMSETSQDIRMNYTDFSTKVYPIVMTVMTTNEVPFKMPSEDGENRRLAPVYLAPPKKGQTNTVELCENIQLYMAFLHREMKDEVKPLVDRYNSIRNRINNGEESDELKAELTEAENSFAVQRAKDLDAWKNKREGKLKLVLEEEQASCVASLQFNYDLAPLFKTILELDLCVPISKMIHILQSTYFDGQSFCLLDNEKLAASKNIFHSDHSYKIAERAIEHEVKEKAELELVTGMKGIPKSLNNNKPANISAGKGPFVQPKNKGKQSFAIPADFIPGRIADSLEWVYWDSNSKEVVVCHPFDNTKGEARVTQEAFAKGSYGLNNKAKGKWE